MEHITLGSFLLRGGAVLALVAANAFFVAAEFSLVASRRVRIEAMVRQGDRKAKLARKAIQSLDKYISGTQLGITVASLGLGWIGEPALASGFEMFFGALPSPLNIIATHTVASIVAFLAITFLHIVLGELAPKALALLHPEETSRWVAGPLIGFTTATNPFIWVLNGTANALLRMFGARPPSEAERVHQPEEIVLLVKQTRESGRLEEHDVRLIEGVFEFTEKTARDVMTPRVDVVGLPADISIQQSLEAIAQSGRSRYPVYEGSLDDIIGIVHVKQILADLQEKGDEPVSTITREPLFVPGSREVEDVLADLKHRKMQMAVVLDEFGGTAGVVTMEDLLEEIVGEIYDEYDEAEPPPAAKGGEAMLPGEMHIEDVNEKFGLSISGENYQTIGGFVFGELGRLPSAGDRVTVKNAMFEVIAMDGRRVADLKLILR